MWCSLNSPALVPRQGGLENIDLQHIYPTMPAGDKRIGQDMTSGIHHVTGLTRDVQANVDFYVGFLGLHLVKRTAGFEDAEQLHLFYGNAAGDPGSIVSFLVWQDGGSGRTGLGQVTEIAFAVPSTEIGDWITRAMSQRITVSGPSREFGETVLRLKDPDGLIVKLVGTGVAGPGIDRLRAVTILTDNTPDAVAMLGRFGYVRGPIDGAITRMISDTDVIDVREVAGYTPGIAGAGTVDHIALRAPDAAAVKAMFKALGDVHGDVNMHDRKYFYSLYVRDAGGVLYEYASDGPGFAVDEAPDALGRILFTPPGDEERSADLAVMLPQFAMPGEERWPTRKMLFSHRLYTPVDASDRVVILLHGTGGDETALLPLGRRVDPQARLIGLRGRAVQEGQLRWFNRFSLDEMDQDDIRSEAEAFVIFMEELARFYDFDPAKALFIGQSNGANFISALLRLAPGLIRKAVLLRGQEVLDPVPEQPVDADILMLEGAQDMLVGKRAATLAANLQAAGATLDHRVIPAPHRLVPADVTEIRDWLAQGKN